MSEARNWTNEELKKLEKELYDIYHEAGVGLTLKAREFLADMQRMDEIRRKQVKEGKWTEEQYKEWRKNKILYFGKYKRLMETVQREMLEVNKKAIEILNGETPKIFAHNYNSIVESFPSSPVEGFTFELVDAETVKRLATSGELMLPPKKDFDPKKDAAWNGKQVNAQILQGILQGESIPKIAARMADVCESNHVAMVRTARTLVTAAENSGRLAGMNKAEEGGMIFEKIWIAATDARTRDSHMALNGKKVKNGEKFKSITGAELEFPGDWRAPGYEVYNCRCSLGTHYIGFKKGLIHKELEKPKEKPKDKVKKQTKKKEESKQIAAKIGGLSAYPPKHQKEILKLLENAPDDVRRAWNAVCDDFHTITGKEYKQKTGRPAKGAFYSWYVDAVYLNIAKSATGEGYMTPYQSVFHEFGHHMDFIMNKRKGDKKDNVAFTTFYKGGIFGDTINSEAEEAILKFGRDKKLFKIITDLDARKEWTRSADIRTKYKDIRTFLKDRVGQEDIDREEAERAFIQHIVDNNSLVARSDISDMFEASMQTKDYPFGCGHGSGYWMRGGARGKEAFAEMFAAKTSNPESWKLINQYFPKSVGIFEDMLKEVE